MTNFELKHRSDETRISKFQMRFEVEYLELVRTSARHGLETLIRTSHTLPVSTPSCLSLTVSVFGTIRVSPAFGSHVHLRRAEIEH